MLKNSETQESVKRSLRLLLANGEEKKQGKVNMEKKGNRHQKRKKQQNQD